MATGSKLNKQSFEQKKRLVLMLERTKLPDATKPRAKAGPNKTVKSSAKKPTSAGTSKAQSATRGQSARARAKQIDCNAATNSSPPTPQTFASGQSEESTGETLSSISSFESRTSSNLSPIIIFKSIQPPVRISKTPEPEPDTEATANAIFGGAWSNPASEQQKASSTARSRSELQLQPLPQMNLAQPKNPDNAQQLGGPHDRSHRAQRKSDPGQFVHNRNEEEDERPHKVATLPEAGPSKAAEKPAKPPAKPPAKKASKKSAASGLPSTNADARPQKTPGTARGQSAGHAPSKSTATQPPTASHPPRKHLRPGRRRNPILKEIIRQNRAKLLIPKLPFQRLVREIIQSRGDYVTRVQSEALRALQESAEMAIVDLFSDSFCMTRHRSKKSLQPKDMHFF